MVWDDKVRMKYSTILITLFLVFAILCAPLIAFASDITDARFFGNITVSNNSTSANTNVATTANISTVNLINGDYLNAGANNTTMRNSSGADIPFMPSNNATNPWVMWIPAIGQETYLKYLLYTAESSGGIIRYFPGSGGMSTADSVGLELGGALPVRRWRCGTGSTTGRGTGGVGCTVG